MYTAQTFDTTTNTWMFVDDNNEPLSLQIKDVKGDTILEGKQYELKPRGRITIVSFADTPENRTFLTHIP